MFFGFILVLFAVSDVSNVFGHECRFDDRQLMNNSTSRNAYDDKNWPKFPKGRRGATIVPYSFVGRTTQKTQRAMKRVFRIIKKRLGSSCPIKFRKRSNPNRNYARLQITQKWLHCMEYPGGGVGRPDYNDNNLVALSMDASPCSIKSKGWKGTAIHEMFHVFGIAHTQKRKDRNKYIRVIEENIKPDDRDCKQPGCNKRQFEICKRCKIPEGIPYECNSIMHYQDHDFAKYFGYPTMKSVDHQRCRPHHLKKRHTRPTRNDWRSLRAALGCRY